jgi:hypothetical protein
MPITTAVRLTVKNAGSPSMPRAWHGGACRSSDEAASSCPQKYGPARYMLAISTTVSSTANSVGVMKMIKKTGFS